MSERISLADISKAAARNFRRANSADISAQAHPTIGDLAESLFFSPGDGRIWLNDQRMILLHTGSFGALRSELIETLGNEKARELLTRVGYNSGARDAALVRRRWPEGDAASAFAGGPRLHALEGIVKVTTVKFDFDVDRGSFYGEFLWHDSMEAAEHIHAYGIGSIPACWMQIGYASGYASAFMGRLIIYRELKCQAMGDPHCHIVGRPAGEWEDAADDTRNFQINALAAPAAPAKRVARPPGPPEDQAMLGISPAFRTAHKMLERVAPTDAAVLLTGETGTGKELFAQALHRISPRAAKPFVAINCAAIPETLVEAELFGVEKGAYTGAHAARAGRFERACGGTLFLDEVNSLSFVAQGKLLRAVQEGVVERVGGTRPVAVDVRIVASSNINLKQEAAAGRFREDLYFRLNVFPLNLPALRERRDDIPLLMDHFLAFYAARHGKSVTGFTSRAVASLLNYNYPGNIRELQNLIERGVICAEPHGAIDTAHLFRGGEQIDPTSFALGARGELRLGGSPEAASLPANNSAGTALDTLADAALSAEVPIESLEKQIYLTALSRCNGNLSAAAKKLGISRPQLEYRLKKFGHKAAVRH
jgi:two-component system response regulator HydG